MVSHSGVWTESFLVRAYEADIAGNLGIVDLCNYLQEVAGNHARDLGVSIEFLQEQQMTWMLSRLHVQMERYPTWRETVVIRTWPSGHNGLHAIREFLIYTEDGTLIGKGTSGWLMIDLKRYRPIRIPAFIDALVTPHLPRPIDDSFNKLPSPKEAPSGPAFRVQYQDLDINQHANSMRFLVWALESVPYEWRTSRTLAGIEAQFRAEAKYGDELVSRIVPCEDEVTFRHGIYEQASGRELAVFRSVWA